MKFGLRPRLNARLFLGFVWLIPLMDIGLAIHAKLVAPVFGAGTALGRWERLDNPWPLCAVLLLCTIWAVVVRWHSSNKLFLFSLLTFGVFLVDSWYQMTSFGMSVAMLGQLAQGFSSAKQREKVGLAELQVEGKE